MLSGGPPESEDDGRRRRLVAIIVAAAVVVVAAVSGYLLVRDDEGEPSARSTPGASSDPPDQTREPSEPSTEPSPGRPTPTPSSSPGPTDSPAPSPGVETRLTFTPLSPPWRDDPGAATILPVGVAQTQVTEEAYNGEDNWVALVAAGSSLPEWSEQQGNGRVDTAASADRVAAWFSGTGFNDADVSRRTVKGDRLRVSGRDGYLLRQHFSYTIPDLESRGETVYVAIVDLGAGVPPGVFVASVPDTSKDLLADVDRAVKSLKVER